VLSATHGVKAKPVPLPLRKRLEALNDCHETV
jgi:hypothetical protein